MPTFLPSSILRVRSRTFPSGPPVAATSSRRPHFTTDWTCRRRRHDAMRLRRTALALAGGLWLGGGALAQIPSGHAVFGSFASPGLGGTPGIFVVPLSGGPTTRIAGLPAELSSASNTYAQGVFGLSLRDGDGALVVTTATQAMSPTQGNLELYVLHLNGLAVDPAQTQRILLGTVQGLGQGIATHAPLPDGRVLVHAIELDGSTFTVSTLQSGPMATFRWAIVDTFASPPSFTLLPTPPGVPGQEFVTLTVDPTGRYAYYLTTTGDHLPFSDSTLLRFDLQTATECQIASFPGECAWGVCCDDDGTVYVSSSDSISQQHVMHTITPDGCNAATVTSRTSSLPILAWGLGLARGDASFLAPSLTNRPGFAGPQLNRLSSVDKATGAVTVLGDLPAGSYGWLAPGVAVNNAMGSYGVPTNGPNRHWFATFPNPTGAPFVGNTAFSLTLESAPGTSTLSAVSLSFGRGSTNVLGAAYLLDPASAVTTIVATGPAVAYPLPIPNDVGFAGLRLNAQSLHLEANNTLTASRGLALAVQVLPAPIVTSVTPSAPPPNTTVTVSGFNFLSGLQLQVAGNPTPILSQTTNTLTFTMPAGAPCDAPIALTNLGNSTGTGTVNVTPAVTFMTANGPAAGNSLFVIAGQHLDGATVTFNGAPPTSITFQSATSIVGLTPPGTPGPAVVLVTSTTGCQTTRSYVYL